MITEVKYMNLPKISVLMPVYNTKEEYLREAIESILNQTYDNFEFIIINDGSTNNAEEVILSYKDKRIRYFKQKNKGVATTLNYGFNLAKCEYIARMDSDDISLPERFAKQVAFLEKNKNVAIIGSWHKEFPKTKISKMPKEIKILDLFRSNLVSHPTIMLRRKEFKKYNLHYNPNMSCEDYELWTRVVRILKFYNLQEVLLLYRVNGQNISSKKGVFTESENKLRRNLLTFLTSDIKLQKKLENLLSKNKNSFWENIFSVKNSFDKKYKIICILGIKIKIKRYK